MNNKSNRKYIISRIIKDYVLITAGTLLVSVGIYFFKFPNNFSIGGVSGVAIILSRLTGGFLSSATVVSIINVLLLIVGYAFLGKSFGTRTLYGTLLFSASLQVLEILVPVNAPITNDPLLDLAFAVILPAVGSAILFNIGASTGGTDIIAVLLKKYTSLDIGISLMIIDFIFTLSVFPVFDTTTGLYSMLGLIVGSTLVDTVIEDLNLHKYFTIICINPKPICDFILNKLDRSATVVDAKGAFTGTDKKIIFTVLSRSQAVSLRKFVKATEPQAFILISNTSEIIGEGFRP